jgi:hypothetical protein
MMQLDSSAKSLTLPVLPKIQFDKIKTAASDFIGQIKKRIKKNDSPSRSTAAASSSKNTARRSISNELFIPGHSTAVNKETRSRSFLNQTKAKEKSSATGRFRFLSSKKFQFLVLPVIFILVIGSLGYYWYFYSVGSLFTATIKYKFVPITATKTVVATTQGGEAGIKTVLLPAEESATVFVNATGERATGEKAKGTVSIFNPTTEIKVIKAGTALACTSNACKSLTYVTNADLNLGPGGSDEVAVTAGDIGENYNLGPGAGKFKVGAFDPTKDVFASNIKAISGGTPKKMVKVVKAEDIKTADENAMKELSARLLDKIKIDPANARDFIIADNTLAVEKISSEADLKEGQDGDAVNVTVKAKANVQAFKKDQIGDIVTAIKNEAKPDGYYLDERNTSFSSKVVSADTKGITVEVTLNSIARPEINVEELKRSLGGKNFGESDTVLSQVKNVSGYTKTYEPQSLPQFFWKIPDNPSRVQIKLVAEQ